MLTFRKLLRQRYREQGTSQYHANNLFVSGAIVAEEVPIDLRDYVWAENYVYCYNRQILEASLLPLSSDSIRLSPEEYEAHRDNYTYCLSKPKEVWA